MIPNTTSARPEDDAYNIQRRCPASRNSTNGLRSTSPSPMDDSSPPSEVDYAERVAANCNMNIEITDPSLPSDENATNFSFSLPASDPRVPLEAAPNPAITGYSDLSTEPSPPEVIPYNANVPVYGTETSRRHLCSAPTNSLTAILITSHVPLNAWHVS